MPLPAGTRIGVYEVTALIGAGGMGEVYRARDSRLGRDLAVKVLPEPFAADAERLARFEREAYLLASLNHPNIAIIHGIEDAGPAAGPHRSKAPAIVMELVEGPTLADRLARGAIPVREALDIGRQIAGALEAAHERGVIHRDLKPANVKVRDDGTVKVLDFGLAKAFDPDPSDPAADLSQSPTITTPAATRAGTLLGTAAYMSPEQAKGRPVDKRTDVWAFGCVLFELLTGQRAFHGDDVSDTLAEILKGEPQWQALPADTPPSIRRLMTRCLARDRKQRVPDISVARFEIEDALSPSTMAAASSPSGETTAGRGPTTLVALASLLAGAALAFGVSSWLREARAADAVRRFALPLDAFQRFTSTANQPLTLSRDGRRLLYVAQDGTASRLWVRSLDRLEAVSLQSAGESVGAVMVSPDGAWAAYADAASGTLKKVRIDTDASVAITPPASSAAGGFRGGTWGTSGTIVFATSTNPGLMQVSDAGGTPVALTRPDAGYHEQPHFLPDGQTLLYTVNRPGAAPRIAVRSLDGTMEHELLDGAWPRYATSGHLLFQRERVVWGVRFNADSLQTSGEPVPVVESVRRPIEIAQDGTLVYVPDSPGFQGRQALVWVDRQGRETPAAPADVYGLPRVSPDGGRVSFDLLASGNTDVVVLDTARHIQLRLTYHPALDRFPIWSRDGQSILFLSGRDGQGIFRKASDGSGEEERLVTLPTLGAPEAISPDGQLLVYTVVDQKTARDIWVLPLAGDRTPRPLVVTAGVEGPADLSPDGRWIAYESNESGRDEIYVQPFPDVGRGRWQITQGGGAKPAWAPSGRELFFHAGRALMAVPVDVSAQTFRWGPAVPVIEGPYFYGNIDGPRVYDVAPDGRLLLLKPAGDSARESLVLVEHWDEELKRLIP